MLAAILAASSLGNHAHADLTEEEEARPARGKVVAYIIDERGPALASRGANFSASAWSPSIIWACRRLSLNAGTGQSGRTGNDARVSATSFYHSGDQIDDTAVSRVVWLHAPRSGAASPLSRVSSSANTLSRMRASSIVSTRASSRPISAEAR